jgi:hypothetical protein
MIHRIDGRPSEDEIDDVVDKKVVDKNGAST